MAPEGSRNVAEIAFAQLRNCLVNLPISLSQALVDSNVAPQNVIAQLDYRLSTTGAGAAKHEIPERSVYVGWTGLSSQARPTARISQAALRSGGSDASPSTVEIDATFGRMLGIVEHSKVSISLHYDPSIAHTVNIEPLTTSDWEILELHATFLETNLQAQIRAIPNPNYSGRTQSSGTKTHPLTLHLSPTSTANVAITSVLPTVSSQVAVLKLSPDAEVIVAPKVRPRLSRSSRTESGSVASASRKSVAGRSQGGSMHHKHEGAPTQKALYLRGLDYRLINDVQPISTIDHTVSVAVDSTILATELLRGVQYVSIVLVSSNTTQPGHLQRSSSRENKPHESRKVAHKIASRLLPWHHAPNPQQAVMSPSLAIALNSEHAVSSILRLEPAPAPVPRSAFIGVSITPFLPPKSSRAEHLKIDPGAKAYQESLSRFILSSYSSKDRKGILDGALTDGLVLPSLGKDPEGWHGGLLHLKSTSSIYQRPGTACWIKGEEYDLKFEVQQGLPTPSERIENDVLPNEAPLLAGSDNVIKSAVKSILHGSSILLCGSLGSGKTSSATAIAHLLRKEHYFHVAFFNCQKLAAADSRISVVSETLDRLSLSIIHGSRLGGRSLLILDDLDKLCPTETELQVGQENNRSRQISEIVRSAVHHMRRYASHFSLLVTAQNKDNVHQVLIQGHVVRETLELRAPGKDTRRDILKQYALGKSTHIGEHLSSGTTRLTTAHGEELYGAMNPTASLEDRLESHINFIDIASRTDGYMPGDLKLLVSRAQGEALSRCIEAPQKDSAPALRNEDFVAAIQGFTPSSLRNVTLQASSVSFDSVGGLQEARRTLIETLQYPTIYAPIFDRCPLRLRSGLLLYGYPGCGKTLLASAVAGECGLNFISVKGPEILNKYIGASEKSVRDLFERAQAAKPCVLFFDEFDSIAPKRGHDSTGVTDRVVNQLLTQMDGAEGLSGVYVLAATSRPDLIDPALLRPGRLDKSLLCDMPSTEERLDILHAVSRSLTVQSSVLSNAETHGTFHDIAKRTSGYTGADLQAVLYNAHLEAVHEALDGLKSRPRASQRRLVKPRHGKLDSVLHEDVLHFAFDRENAQGESRPYMDSQARAKLESLQENLLRLRAARRRQRGSQRPKGEDEGGSASAAKGVEVVIHWRYLEKSLETTKSSMSNEERYKFDRIYWEFQTSRSGEMPSGQASKEIGARSSLM